MVSHSHSLLLLAVTTAEGRLGLTRQQLRLRVRRVRARRALHLLEPFAVPEDPAAAFETALSAVLQTLAEEESRGGEGLPPQVR